MSRAGRKTLRVIRDPFVVAAPGGARIRTRLHLSAGEAGVLRQAGTRLGYLAHTDLVARLAVGDVPAKGNQRADRKRGLSPASSSRWAGSLTCH
jgi:hypothetical protein